MTYEKLCVFCEHWRLDPGCADYSEVTPGDIASMYCSKQQWAAIGFNSLDRHEFRAIILKGETCPHFELDASEPPAKPEQSVDAPILGGPFYPILTLEEALARQIEREEQQLERKTDEKERLRLRYPIFGRVHYE